MKAYQKSRRGFSSVLAMFFVCLFAVLAVSFTAMSDVNVQMSYNHRDMAAAQAAAESGLQYGHYLVNSFIADAATRTFSNTVSDDDATEAFSAFAAYVEAKLNDSGILGDKTIVWKAGDTELLVPEISLLANDAAQFSLEVTVAAAEGAEPPSLIVTSTGARGAINRTASLSYTMAKDTQILEFAIASRSRVIMTGDSTVERGLYSDWEHTDIAPPITTEAESTVVGALNTPLSEEDFPLDQIVGDYDGINYDQPPVDLPDADDFDTSIYADMTSTLPNTGVRQTEYFPHAPDDYTRPANWTSVRLTRTVYGPADPNESPLVITNKMLAAGGNALFRNCVFEGVLYIGNGGGIGTNNIRFENCTFNGTIATGVPPTFGPETWKKNVLYFTGNSAFDNQTMVETTILAPNYNVNIGNTKTLEDGSESVLRGVVLGGVVDIRGNLQVDGTIVSMHYPDPDDWGQAAGQVATNIGYSDENMEAGVPNEGGVIFVSPSPDQMLPLGMSSRILLTRQGNSYVEL